MRGASLLDTGSCTWEASGADQSSQVRTAGTLLARQTEGMRSPHTDGSSLTFPSLGVNPTSPEAAGRTTQEGTAELGVQMGSWDVSLKPWDAAETLRHRNPSQF